MKNPHHSNQHPAFATPDDAERAFYDALARFDINAMMAVWAEDEEIVCIHPGGPRLTGLSAIRESWQQLFANEIKLYVRTTHLIKTETMLMATHCLMVYISIDGHERDEGVPPPIYATNVFIRGPHGWQLLIHHASHSPEDNPLLNQDAPTVVH